MGMVKLLDSGFLYQVLKDVFKMLPKVIGRPGQADVVRQKTFVQAKI